MLILYFIGLMKPDEGNVKQNKSKSKGMLTTGQTDLNTPRVNPQNH